MRFSLMTYTVHGGQPGGLGTLEEIADFARELDFAALELSARDLQTHTPAQARAICAARGLAISCINGGAELAAQDEAQFAAGLAQGRGLIAAAAAMDCPVVMVIPGRALGPADKPRAAQRIAQGLCALVPDAEAAGIALSIEDFPSPLAPYASIAEIAYLLEAVPGLGLTFDNGNWVVGGDDPVAAVQAFGDRIVNCHVKDWEVDPTQSRIQLPDGRWMRGGLHGQGILDHRAILSALMAVGYDGTLAFEYEGVMDHVEATRQGMAYLRGVLEDLGVDLG
ncbi:MAG: sugar phosphate isomerase/epimerase family protein [Armatimonadota bacterium]